MAVYQSVPPERPAKKVASKRQKKAVSSARQRRNSQMQPVDWAEGQPSEFAERRTRGFENNARRIAQRQGISMERARAILAAGARSASPAAKRANPALKRVRGSAKGSK